MTVPTEDFIRVYESVYPEGYCAHLISEFERLVGSGAGVNRQAGEGAKKHIKNDMQLEFNIGSHTVAFFENAATTDVFFSGLQKCFEAYVGEFSTLGDSSIRGTAMKMQRTSPGGGYHVWHGEQGNGVSAGRVLVYSVYLNTLSPEEAGETEYLYQQRRVSPVENSLVIWPATFTHAHRGNTVFGKKCKYIATGWFCYD
tara:strand:+ start:797 stop:1393 length:597 start_codon:yes stop_codon:yes gene_type:complete